MSTLLRTLQDFSPAMLRALAENHGVALSSNTPRAMADELAAVIAERTYLADAVADLPPAARDALAHLIQEGGRMVDGERIAVGNQRYFAAFDVENGAEVEGVMAALHDAGKTAVIIARMKDGKAHLLGVIGIADILRPDAAAVVRQLKALGVAHIVMLTGDNPRVAQAIAREVGLDEVHAGLMPEDKMNIIKELGQKYGPVAMVGDGVNDAPALALAEIGIAMGAAGTDVALESAEVVLMADDLNNIPYVIALSRQTRKTLLQNLTFAIGMILVLILSVLGFNLALPLSVVGHEGSTVLVSLNGLRMLGYRYQPKPTDQAVAE